MWCCTIACHHNLWPCTHFPLWLRAWEGNCWGFTNWCHQVCKFSSSYEFLIDLFWNAQSWWRQTLFRTPLQRTLVFTLYLCNQCHFMQVFANIKQCPPVFCREADVDKSPKSIKNLFYSRKFRLLSPTFTPPPLHKRAHRGHNTKTS